MTRRVVIGLVALAFLAVAAPRPAHAGEVEEQAARVEKLEKQRAGLDAERKQLEAQLAAKTKEIAALKKQRGSWNRDQKLNSKLAEAKDLAIKLDAKADQIRAVDAQIKGARTALVAAIDKELAKTTDGKRKAKLAKLRAEQQKKLGAGKKIQVADEELSPLDDPEDIEEKAATLEESEAKLRAEEKRLAKRADYYRKQAKLQRSKQREKEQDIFDDQPRRGQGGASGGRGGGGDVTAGAQSPTEDFEANDGAAGPPAAVDDLAGDPSVIYADVVDPETVAELEKAERSGDPEAKAKAADKARADVKKRADKLKAKREQFLRRAKELREAGE